MTMVQTHTLLLERGEGVFLYPSEIQVAVRPTDTIFAQPVTVSGELLRSSVTGNGEVVRGGAVHRSETWSCSFESESSELLSPIPEAGFLSTTSKSTLVGRLLDVQA